MKGFSNNFVDLPDYILGITKEIWEERGLEKLHSYYSSDIIVRSPGSIVTGNQNVISATMATLAEFPDRRLLGEDVIWSGTPKDGMLSANLNIISKEYDRAVTGYYPGGKELISTDGVDTFWVGLRSSFPSAKFEIHHQIGRDDPGMSPRAAVRWSLTGKHDGWGTFGPPSGAEVHVMGISHAEFGPWGLRREYTLFDETVIWKQIAIKKG